MSYLVSVVVPTKNRYKYLKHLIKLVDSFQLPELEFVIQDNSDDNSEILSFLKSYSNPHIKYFYSTDALTMSQNGELAIRRSTGDYVCYIGDDDGVCRNIVDCARWMKSKEIDAAFNTNVWYNWNGNAKLQTPADGYILHDTQAELHSLLKKGCNLLETNMPMIYHGIVRKTVLEEIIQRYGTLFPSVPPDISGSICLASVIDKCCELRTPVIINGTSQMTGGGVVGKGGVLELNDVGFITQQDIEEWENNIPPIWCGNFGWANSAIKTLRKTGHYTLAEKVDFEYCFAKAVSLRPQKKELWKFGEKYSTNRLKFFVLVMVLMIKKYYKKLSSNMPWAIQSQTGLKTIVDAEAFFMIKTKTFPSY